MTFRTAPRAASLAVLIFAGCGEPDSPPLAAPPQLCRPAAAASPLLTLPPPPLRTGIGRTPAFPVTSQVAAARDHVRQGVALLHGFWEFEAERSFRHAAQLDPDCAMAYWGQVLCQPGREPEFPERRALALAALHRLAPGASSIEQRYIAALHALLDSGPNAYGDALLALWKAHPDQIDAGAWAAYYHLDAHQPDGLPSPRQQTALEIIHDLLRIAPEHPGVLHYAVHLYEIGPQVAQAAPWAEQLAELAPDSGHLVHMAGHVAYFTDRFAQAREAFLRALAVDRAYLSTEAIDPTDHPNHAHNLHFLALACVESGHLEDAFQYAAELRGLTSAAGRPRSAVSALHQLEISTLEARLHLRLRQPDQAIAALDARIAESESDSQRAYLRVFRHFATVLATRVSDPATARTALAEIADEVGRVRSAAEAAPLTSHGFYLQRAARQVALLEKGARALAASDPAAARIYLSEWSEQAFSSERMDPPLLPLSPQRLAEWIGLD